MKRKIFRLLFSLVQIGSPQRRAFASCIGLLLGFLPLHSYGGLIGIVLALILRLNLFALFIGFSMQAVLSLCQMFIALTFPSLHLLPPLQQSLYLLMDVLLVALFFPVFAWFYRDPDLTPVTAKRFIFQDHGRRWSFFRRTATFLLILSLVTLIIFGESLYQNPIVPQLINQEKASNSLDITPIREELPSSERTDELKYRAFDPSLKQSSTPVHTPPVRYGFYVPWDPRGWVQLRANDYIGQVDVLIPQWYSLNDDLSLDDQRQPLVDQLAKQHHVAIMPLINNVQGEGWDGNLLHQLLQSPPKRTRLINQLLQQMQKNGYIGINVNFDAIQSKDRQALTSFIADLSRTFHKHHLQVTLDVPVDDPAFDYQALSQSADQLVVMMYEEHFAEGKPGPLASLGWVKHTLDQLPIPVNKRIISLGNYGYDWKVGSMQPAVPRSFDEIMWMANRYHLTIQWDNTSKNAYMRYKKGDQEHIVWFLDGASFYDQLKVVSAEPIHGVAFWRLGSEDPAIWNLFGRTGNLSHVNEMQQFISKTLLYTGQGEIVHVNPSAKSGERSFQLDANQWIQQETYTVPSTPIEVNRTGQPTSKQIALTFDDGPDPEYTSDILNILDRYHIKATFFIVGKNAILHPELIARMYQSGDDVGNHTYSHPDLNTLSPDDVKLEFNLTQRFFQQLTGHTMTLMRPPYYADIDPTSQQELTPILLAQQYGYTMVGETIDSNDWRYMSKPIIIQQVKDQLPFGNVILMHDAGGDRSATVAALPQIIKMLQHQGYQFVTIHQLMGKNRAAVMPPIQASEQSFMVADRLAFSAMQIWEDGFAWAMYGAIAFGVLRFAVLMYFAYRQRVYVGSRRRQQDFRSDRENFQPLVSVVISAYNEEKVVSQTLQSVLRSDYPCIEIVVVNDGSTDRTEEVVRSEFADLPHITLISKPNTGKTDSLNHGFQVAKGDIIVTIDADTIVKENAISMLVRNFIDPEVAAVSGNVKVGNVRNLLTLWQHVEYITGFNLERRAFDELNCITIVPGAIGAWRKSALAEVGYFQHDTLAEDTDMTLTLLRHGYHVRFEDESVALTEAPEDIRSFLKQRTRWIYGTLQCLWKHRAALFTTEQKTLGFISLPSMWFQYAVQVLSPFVDLLCILSLFTNYATIILSFYVLFLVFDIFVAFFAFSLENESPQPLMWLFLQRFIYRQFMTYVLFTVFVSILQGVSVNWNKLVRKGFKTSIPS